MDRSLYMLFVYVYICIHIYLSFYHLIYHTYMKGDAAQNRAIGNSVKSFIQGWMLKGLENNLLKQSLSVTTLISLLHVYATYRD